jgi:D-arabinonate dehydratase
MINEEMAPLLLGQSVASIEDIWSLTRKSTEPFLRDRRVALRAQSCIDSALHDAIGKLVGLPINALWGGAKKDIRVFALGGYYREKNDLEGLAQEVEDLKAFGIYGLKLKLGGKSPSEDAKRAEVVRKAAGNDFILGRVKYLPFL